MLRFITPSSFIRILLPLLLAVPGVRAATFVVNATGDVADGACNAAHCSLRDAIEAAEALPDADTISFNIAGSGPHIIRTTARLQVTQPLTIDGYSQPGSSPNTLALGSDAVLKIRLDGLTAVGVQYGLEVFADVTIRGIMFTNWRVGGLTLVEGRSVVEGCYFGTNELGQAGLGNLYGLVVFSAANTIGGSTPAARNVLSGNADAGLTLNGAAATGNLVYNNYVGPHPQGTTAIGTQTTGIVIEEGASGNDVGGAGSRANLVSGNGSGVFIQGAATRDNRILGNLIGTDRTGSAALPNGSGILVTGAVENVIGGAGLGNVISGNSVAGILLAEGATANTVLGNFIGVDASGSAALPNLYGVQVNAGGNDIGAPSIPNVISGNADQGIQLASSGNRVRGNVIGLDDSETFAIPNGRQGVVVFSGSGNVIGGSEAGEGNVISGNATEGVDLVQVDPADPVTGTVIAGNKIGLDGSCTIAVPNGASGVRIFGAAGNVVGPGSTARPGGANVIGGNTWGVLIQGAGATGNRVRGNLIGANCAFDPAPNTIDGIRVERDASGTIVGGSDLNGRANTIIHNGFRFADSGASGGTGVIVLSGVGNEVTGNRVHSNGGPGIRIGSAVASDPDPGDADAGVNLGQNQPVIDGADLVTGLITGHLDSAPGASYMIELGWALRCHESGFGEFEQLLQREYVTTDASGRADFSFAFADYAPAGATLVATATDASGNTSNPSRCFEITPRPQVVMTPDPLDLGVGDTVTVTVVDVSADRNALVRETVRATVTSSSDAVGIPIDLVEADTSDTAFIGTFRVGDGPSDAGAGLIAALPGQLVFLNYPVLDASLPVIRPGGADADGDGLGDAQEAGFGGTPPSTSVFVSNPETGNRAGMSGTAASGATVTSGSFTVEFPPGTTASDSSIVVAADPEPPAYVIIDGADLAGGTKTVTLPFELSTLPLACVRDEPDVTSVFAGTGCQGVLMRIPLVDGATQTLNLAGDPVPWVLTRVSTAPPLIRVEGLQHTGVGTTQCPVVEPVVTCPPDVQRECTEDLSPGALGLPSHASFCQPVRITSSDAEVASCGAARTIQRTFTLTDDLDTLQCTQVIQVVDTVAPQVTAPPSAVAECGAVPPPAAPAVDDCDPAPALGLHEQRIDGPCPGTYRLVRTWTVTDACGQSSSAVQSIDVQDTRPPTISAPADIVAECDAVPAPARVTAVDDCDPAPSVAFREERIDGRCPGEYRLVRTWTATDACGNAADAVQVVQVVDTTPPVVTPSHATAACLWPPRHGYVVFSKADFAPVIADNCAGTPTWRFVGCASDQADDGRGDGSTDGDCVVDPSGETIAVRAERSGTTRAGRTHEVRIVAQDACGNVGASTVIGLIAVPHDGAARDRDCAGAILREGTTGGGRSTGP